MFYKLVGLLLWKQA